MMAHSDADPKSQKIADIIAEALVKAGYSVETRSSVVHTRIYIGADNARTNEHYVIELDQM